MKALFLTECGATSGMGHLRRCQVLARAMMAEGWACSFGLSDAGMVDAVRKEGFDAHPWVDDGINLGRADVLVLDGYHYDPELLTRWRDRSSITMAVDDLADRPVPADVILNHNIYGAELDYASYNAKKVIAGPAYSLVGENFFAVASTPRPYPAHVLVSFGGTDDGRYSLPMAEAFLTESPDTVVEVVISPVQTPSVKFATLQKSFGSRLVVHHGAEMPSIMGRCRILAGAAGVTVIEALAAAVSPVVCAIADNQHINIKALRKMGFDAFDSFDPNAMVKAALPLLHKNEQTAKKLVDPQGPNRIIAILSEVFGKN
ncbi:MAG: hypothetical protein OEY84_00115 [Rhodospirillaceae bacterium]|nr:hypothetical protein [Rhodospirillaceae bacterium]